MKNKKVFLSGLALVACLVLFTAMPVFAAELTEAQVEEAVASQGKEAVTGNIFISVPLPSSRFPRRSTALWLPWALTWGTPAET